ncbi:PREDICTED: uncharacterized protein LOC109176066 [Ipomoea nil]|uniref:uncharacterized protein LOC109176066 n=1 Tax=Ipomoea nil TaxID=35883 RepID=UPI0009018B32|nr:PREDICTED: uncharacterized protein LOC109176066 [Ipomoea nil]
MEPQQSPDAFGDDYSDITLRPLEPSDAEDYLEFRSDDNVTKFCSWEPFTSVEAAAKYIAEDAAAHPWYRGICVKGKAVGSVTVKPFRGCDSCRAEIGYALASKYWGKGIATKAVKMAAASVFVEWAHLERLEAVVDVENRGSQRVLEKAGFKREAVLRKYYLLKGNPTDAVMFSLISTDPEVTFFM